MAETRWSELGLIELFKKTAGTKKHAHLIKGIGDDCAVFENIEGRTWITTTDILVENIHFNRSWHPPDLLGRKSIAVNLSDIAAMGGNPEYALLSVAIPESIDKNWVDHWFRGVVDMLDAYDCTLIGGDTAKGDVLTINVVIVGSVAKGQAIMRSSAEVGQNVYVSGPLGSAGAGLEICRDPSSFDLLEADILEPMRRQHLDPEPEISLGTILGASGLVGAMQDLSDGLATDMAHIAKQSGVGAEIDASLLPAEQGLDRVCTILGKSIVSMQVSAGEDYKLLFTVKKQADEQLMSQLEDNSAGPVYRIGRIVEKPGVRLKKDGTSTDISFQGYQHSGA